MVSVTHLIRFLSWNNKTEMKMLWILLFIGLTFAEKLDRTYLPPPGSHLSGGSPGAIDIPLEYPKLTYNGQKNTEKPQIALGINREGPKDITKTLYKETKLSPNEPINSNENSFSMPTTSTSYAFTQTTIFSPIDGYSTPIPSIPFDTALPENNSKNQQNVMFYNTQPSQNFRNDYVDNQKHFQVPSNADNNNNEPYYEKNYNKKPIQEYSLGGDIDKIIGVTSSPSNIEKSSNINQNLNYPFSSSTYQPESEHYQSTLNPVKQDFYSTGVVPSNGYIESSSNTDEKLNYPYSYNQYQVRPENDQSLINPVKQDFPSVSSTLPRNYFHGSINNPLSNDNGTFTSSIFQGSLSTPVSSITDSDPTFENHKKIKQYFERPQAQADREAEILNYDSIITPEGYAYSFDTSNGIHADESGIAINGVRAKGSYSYIGDDGKNYSVTYTADENGFRPYGDHLPTSPPIPDAILKVIEQVMKEKEAGIYDDGSYDENKYGYKNYGQKIPDSKQTTPKRKFFGSDPHKEDNNQHNQFNLFGTPSNNFIEGEDSQDSDIKVNSEILDTDILSSSENNYENDPKSINEFLKNKHYKKYNLQKDNLENDYNDEILKTRDGFIMHEPPNQIHHKYKDINKSLKDFVNNYSPNRHMDKISAENVNHNNGLETFSMPNFGTETQSEIGYEYYKPQIKYSDPDLERENPPRFSQVSKSNNINFENSKIIGDKKFLAKPFMTKYASPKNDSSNIHEDEYNNNDKNLKSDYRNSQYLPSENYLNKTSKKENSSDETNFKTKPIEERFEGHHYDQISPEENRPYYNEHSINEQPISTNDPTLYYPTTIKPTHLPTQYATSQKEKGIESSSKSPFNSLKVTPDQTIIINRENLKPSKDELERAEKPGVIVDNFGKIIPGNLVTNRPTLKPTSRPNNFGFGTNSGLYTTPYPAAYDNAGKIIGEDFSGPKQPQKYDPATGYHY